MIVYTSASFAVLDPAYTMSLPPMQVLSGAFDTLNHAMETYLGSSGQDNVSDVCGACNHGQGLAVIHPANYRHILKDAQDKFTRFASVVFGLDTAEAGIEALADFIKESSCLAEWEN